MTKKANKIIEVQEGPITLKIFMVFERECEEISYIETPDGKIEFTGGNAAQKGIKEFAKMVVLQRRKNSNFLNKIKELSVKKKTEVMFIEALDVRFRSFKELAGIGVV